MAAFGDRRALPWWYGFLMQAEEWNIPPWELFDSRTSRAFWLECAGMLRQARAKAQAAAERRREHAHKNDAR